VSPQWHPASCKVCGARRPWVHVSATGLCLEHSKQRMERNLTSLKEGRGPDFDKWAQAIARGVIRRVRAAQGGGVLLDEQREQG